MRIISVDKPELTVRHDFCGATIGYIKSEIKHYTDYCYVSEYYIVCPYCNTQISLNKNSATVSG